MTRGLIMGLVTLTACQGVSPLTNQLAVGEEAIVILVGEGQDGYTDLFAGSPGGGILHRISFTRDRESAPALHPAGTAVAFLRRGAREDDPTTWLVVMNLVNAAEREVVLPPEVGNATRVGWNRDGSTLSVRGDRGLAVTAAPPARLALTILTPAAPDYAAADSATRFLLGDPALAEVGRCPDTDVACIRADTLPPEPLNVTMAAAFRWGSDSLATLEGAELRVRPLGGGRSRRLSWTNLPTAPREGTYWAPALSLEAGSSSAPQGLLR